MQLVTDQLQHSPLSRFIVQAVLIVSISRVLGFLLRRIGQPMVIAEIVSGIVLGPSLLGWLWPDLWQVLFPASAVALLSMLSQVGLVLFMFLVGLELDLKLLRGSGQASLVISNSSIALPFALGAGLALYAYRVLADPQVPLLSFTLFMGAAMSVTAFPVLARILNERRLLQTKIGVLSITSAAINDVTAWCMLAFVVSIVRSTGISSAVRTTALTLLYLLAMFFLVRPILSRLAARSLGREGLNHNVVAATLIALLLSSLVTEFIGIHALFGAFLLGAILPKTDGFAATLAEKLEDLVLVFLLPLFFAVSGLRTQVGLLNSAHGWGLFGLILLAACLGKFGGSTLAARLTGLTWRESSAIGVLMNTRGLMELVVLNIGLDLGVISPTLFTMMVLMALFTTFITSPLLQLIYPHEQKTRELAGNSLDPSPLSDPAEAPLAKSAASPDVILPPLGARAEGRPGFVVLLCVAFERSGPALVAMASALVGRLSSADTPRGRLYALRLIPPSDRLSDYVQPSQPQPEQVLAPLLARAAELGAPVRPLAFISPQPGRDICNVAEVKGADLILLGWHKPVLSGNVLGGTVREVLSSAPMDVGVLIDRGLGPLRRVLVLYHGTADDLAAVRMARRLVSVRPGAEASPVQVTLFAVVPGADAVEKERQALHARFVEADAILGASAAGDPTPSSPSALSVKVCPHAEPAEAALAEAQTGYDLVMVGIGPDWGLEQRSIGLASEPLLQRCPVSILILRAGSAPSDVPIT
jgi:Kef-type K+ transport system membrane component KefB/nucleotide-binding universal stress UspA family protein